MSDRERQDPPAAPEPGADPAEAPGGDADDSEPVPRLPRGRGLRFSTAEIVRILMFAALLVAVISLRKPCAEGMAGFVDSFSPPDAGPPPEQTLPPGEYIQLRGDETEEELRQTLEGVHDGDGADAGTD